MGAARRLEQPKGANPDRFWPELERRVGTSLRLTRCREQCQGTWTREHIVRRLLKRASTWPVTGAHSVRAGYASGAYKSQLGILPNSWALTNPPMSRPRVGV